MINSDGIECSTDFELSDAKDVIADSLKHFFFCIVQ